MSLECFRAAKQLVRDRTPLETLVMAVVLSSDLTAWLDLRRIWPKIVSETVARELGNWVEEEVTLND